MLFPSNIIDTISDCVSWADRLTKSDLIAGVIVTENDYTSNFTAALRREIAARSIPNLKARIQVLNPSAERGNGVDGCIIFSNTKEFKAGMFEAKWPRLTTNRNSWDSIQRSSGISHFDEQLKRQTVAARSGIAVWEMFYSEHDFGEQPKFMPEHGSACVSHERAYAASKKRVDKGKPWSDEELEALLLGESLDTATVVRQMCECKRGTAMPEQNYATALSNFGPPKEALVLSYPKAGQTSR